MKHLLLLALAVIMIPSSTAVYALDRYELYGYYDIIERTYGYGYFPVSDPYGDGFYWQWGPLWTQLGFPISDRYIDLMYSTRGHLKLEILAISGQSNSDVARLGDACYFSGCWYPTGIEISLTVASYALEEARGRLASNESSGMFFYGDW